MARERQEEDILNAVQKTLKRATDPNRPIRDQLSPKDVGDVEALYARRKTIGLDELIESEWARDLHVASDIYALAVQLHKGGEPPPKGHAQYQSFVWLNAMRALSKSQKITEFWNPPPDKAEGCSLSSALHEQSVQSFEKMKSMPIRLLPTFDLALKDRSSFEPQGKELAEKIDDTVLNPTRRELGFFADMENLRTLVAVSSLYFESSKKDAAASGGNTQGIGKTLSQMTFDERTRIFFNVRAQIAKENPSDMAKRMQPSNQRR